MTPTDSLVQVARNEHGVATLAMNRPERHNALSAGLIDALGGALAALEADPAVRLVVLAGRGPTFCAGADLGEMRQAAAMTGADNEREALRLATLLERLDSLSKPTVARIHGNAFGGALGLIAACDIAIAALDCQFALTEVRLGLVPAMISPYVVRAIGERQARRYFLTAEGIDATQAERIGLVHGVVPTAALDAEVQRLAAALLQGAPGAQGEAKRLIRHVTGRSDAGDRALKEQTARWIARLRSGAEGTAGLEAFLGKRPPGWTP